jgi:hypothetical protein
MNKNDLINAFLNGNTKGKGSNLEIERAYNINGEYITALSNYQTTIAYRLSNGDIVLNSRKYSQTTTVNQNIIRRNTSTSELYEIDILDLHETVIDLIERINTGKRIDPARYEEATKKKKLLKAIFIK